MNRLNQYLENIFFLSATFLLSPFFYTLSYVRRSKKPSKILVIQTAKIGDLICSTPVFREIKKHYPKSFLSVLIIPRAKGVIINNPYIDEIILLDRGKYSGVGGILKLIGEIREKRFDWSINLLPGILNYLIPFWSVIPNRVTSTSKYTVKGAKILSIFNNYRLDYPRHSLALRQYLNLLKFLGISKVSEKKDLFTKPADQSKALDCLRRNNLKSDDFLVGISVTAGNVFKEWSLDKFAELADRLTNELKVKVIFAGSRQDGKIISETQSRMSQKSFDSSQFFSLSEVPSLFKYFKIFISVDTGSLYIANAMDVPVVDIAGPIDIYEQPPLGDRCEIVQKNISCVPCSFIIPPARFCKQGHCQCIETITVDDVFQAVLRLMKEIV